MVIENVGTALAKITEGQADEFLDAAPHQGHVLHRIQAARWRADNVIRGNDPGRVAALPRDHEGRALSIRLWRDAVSLPHGGVTCSNVVIPDTYRRRHDDRLRSEAMLDWQRWFARTPQREPAERLTGTYFHLDNEWRGHFGHALTEQAAKLWAWPWIKQHHPDTRVLMHARADAPVATWELDLLAAGGIDRRDIVVCHHPVQVENLITASPALSTPTTLHPILRETYNTIGARLEASASQRSWPERVFFTRRPTHQRRCHNTEEVEALMRDHGFEVIHPEDHPLADQATFVRRASVVAGFTGSGMYQIALAGGPRQVFAIGSDSYTGWIEPRLADLLGHRLELIWCTSDAGRSTTYTRQGFKADFTFDRERDGRYLTESIERLDYRRGIEQLPSVRLVANGVDKDQ